MASLSIADLLWLSLLFLQLLLFMLQLSMIFDDRSSCLCVCTARIISYAATFSLALPPGVQAAAAAAAARKVSQCVMQVALLAVTGSPERSTVVTTDRGFLCVVLKPYNRLTQQCYSRSKNKNISCN